MTSRENTHWKKGNTEAVIEQFSIVYRTVEEMISLNELDAVLENLINQIRIYLDVEIVSIMMYGKKEDELTIKAACGLPKRVIDSARVKIGEGIAGKVIKDKKPLLISDISADKRFSPSAFAYQYTTGSLICVPLIVKDISIGVLSVNNKSDSAKLTEEDLRFCIILGNLAAIAINNAQLLEETRDRAVHFEKLNEELREINEQLLHQDLRRNRFLSAIAHELNTPLTSIKGYTELLERISVLPERVKSFVSMMSKEIRRLVDLTGSLLDISRIYSRKIPIQRRRVLIKELFERCQSLVIRDLEEKKIGLVIDLVDESLMGFIDPDRFFQVILNLVSNAIKYSFAGVIVLAAWREDDNSIIFSIQDQGVGIPEDDIPHLFEEFYRVQSHQHLGMKGSGLGLALVKSIVDAHNAHITIESEENVGTTITITVPIEYE